MLSDIAGDVKRCVQAKERFDSGKAYLAFTADKYHVSASVHVVEHMLGTCRGRFAGKIG